MTKLVEKQFPLESFTIVWYAIQLFPFYTLSALETSLIFTLIMGIKYYLEGFRFNYFFFFITQLILMTVESNAVHIAFILFSSFMIDFFPVYEYPDPTGSHKVGYKSVFHDQNLDMAVYFPTSELDPSRNEVFDKEDKVSGRNYYGFKLIVGHYFPLLAWIVPKFLVDLAHTFFRKVHLKVTKDAEIIPPICKKGFPVIVFSHGLGAYKHLFSIYFREWASQGYIVFSVDHDEKIFYKWKEYANFVSVRQPQLEVRIATIKRVLDWIHNDKNINTLFGPRTKIDHNKVFMAGHSFGSATSASFVSTDKRVTGGLILLDPWLDPCDEGIITQLLKKPAIILRSEQFDKMKQPIREKVLRFVKANNNLTFSGYFKGTTHNDVTDFILTKPKKLLKALRLSRESDAQYRENIIISHMSLIRVFLDKICQAKETEDLTIHIQEMKREIQLLMQHWGTEAKFHLDQ